MNSERKDGNTMTSIIDAALARQEARPVKRIDYERMQRVGRGQKAALTRAERSGDAERVARVCRDAVREWNEIGAWPDEWSRWQRALDDAAGRHVSLDEL